ncbi:unnamed protein product [Ophioblennius macclurei]
MSLNKMRLSVYDQSELQKKLQLMESDRKAHKESAQRVVERNKETLRQLRQDTKRMYRELSTGESTDSLLRAAFQSSSLEYHVFRNKSEKEILRMLEMKRQEEIRKLNALKHVSRMKQRHLDELQVVFERRTPERGSTAYPDTATREATTKALDNKLQEVRRKRNTVENIISKNLEIKEHLQDKSLTFESRIRILKEEIQKHWMECQSLLPIYANATVGRREAEAELQQRKDQLERDRKERDRAVAICRRAVEELSAEAESRDHQVTMTMMQINGETQRSAAMTAAEKDRAYHMTIYRKLKYATGATDMQEIVEKFCCQRERLQQQRRMKEESEAVLLQLKTEDDLLTRSSEGIVGAREDKLSSERAALEESQVALQHLHTLQLKSQEVKERLERLKGVFSVTRDGVQHLTDRLRHVPLIVDTDVDDGGEEKEKKEEEEEEAMDPESVEFVPEQMKRSELKLRLLESELREKKDLTVVVEEMERKRFVVKLDENIPEYNIRIKLPEDQAPVVYEDDEDAGVLSRKALLRQSQQIIEANSKKKSKPWF